MTLSNTLALGYVGFAHVDDEKNLRTLIEHYSQPGDYFFLRWLHQVSGIKVKGIETNLLEELSPEGQFFNHRMELRWKKRRRGYEVLWLGQQAPSIPEKVTPNFTPISRRWCIEDHHALLHSTKTPQYPNLFDYPSELDRRIRQRYFRDAETNIVHFIALTVAQSQS